MENVLNFSKPLMDNSLAYYYFVNEGSVVTKIHEIFAAMVAGVDQSGDQSQ